MKNALLVLAFAIMLPAIASPLAVRAASDDTAQINALYQQFATAFRHKDVNGTMAVYVPGNELFVFDVGTPREHVGWNSYRQDWVGFYGVMKGMPDVSIGELNIVVSGDVAYTRSVQHVSMATKNGQTRTMNVRVTDVLRKVNGKWLIVQEHVSLPIDMDTLKPDMLSRP